MAKNTKKSQKKQKNNNARRAGPKPVRGTSDYYVDGAAMEHIKLMSDPCQGRLVPPAYPQPGGGAIQRFRASGAYAVGAADTALLFHWTPGINEFINNAAVSGATNFTPNPGTVFPALANTSGVGTSATNFRCVAACLKIFTNASEANRAGMVFAGQTTNQYMGINGAAVTNVNTMLAGLPVTARVPSKCLEILWCPSLGDQGFYADYTGATVVNAQAMSSYGSCTFCALGLPAGTGLTVEMTAVYEINYGSNGNVVSTPAPITSTSWNNVLRAYSAFINYAPVIVDTARTAIEYMGMASSSQPGRAVAGASRKYITI